MHRLVHSSTRSGQRAGPTRGAAVQATVAILATCALVFSLLLVSAERAKADTLTFGAGSVTDTLPPGANKPTACGNIANNPREFVTESAPAGAVPTNDWWSSLLFKRNDCAHSATLVAGPLSFQTGSGGLGVSYPTTPTIVGSANSTAEYHYQYAQDFRLGVAGLNAPNTKVAGWSDWTVTPHWSDGARSLSATIGHGQPFIYANATGGAAQLNLVGSPEVWRNNGSQIGFRINGHDYVAFAPTGATWTQSGNTISSDLAGESYFSVAVLPTEAGTSAAQRRELADQFAPAAFAFVTDTKVAWDYNPANSKVTADYRVTTEPKQGSDTNTVIATVPHQTKHLVGADPLPQTYVSPRGDMQVLVNTDVFTTRMNFNGVLPEFPTVGLDAGLETELADLVRAESSGSAFAGFAEDTYWTGKALGRATQLARIADQMGMVEQRDQLLQQIRERLTDWFTATPGKASRVLYYDSNWGTLTGFPASYGSDTDLNDHHFHYGYFVAAAAELGQHDPAWAAQGQYGAMVDQLIRDANNYDRTDDRYPFLRSHDIYAGHSWASGHGGFFAGNNQESSSESINYSQAMIQWGIVTGNDAVRDAGIYLYTTETAAVEQYWHDRDGTNFPQDFPHDSVGMVWGDGGAYATWFSGEPEMIQGINMLPMTASSLHLGHDTDYVRSHLQELRDTKGRPLEHWLDVIWQFQALADPEAAWSEFRTDPDRGVEEGESKSHVFHSLRAQTALGQVDPTITADTPLHAVFKNNGERSYLAANATPNSIDVTFSDGTTMSVSPGASKVKGAVSWHGGTNTGVGADPQSPTPTPTPTLSPTLTPSPSSTQPSASPTPTTSSPTPDPSPPGHPAQGWSAYAPIEAEAASANNGGAVQAGHVGALSNGDWLQFDDVEFGAEGPTQVHTFAAGGSDGSGLVQFRTGSTTGPVVADFAIGDTGGWTSYRTIPANAQSPTGKQTVFVTFESGYPGDYVDIDRFVFQRSGDPIPDLAVVPTPTPTQTPGPTATETAPPNPEPSTTPPQEPTPSVQPPSSGPDPSASRSPSTAPSTQPSVSPTSPTPAPTQTAPSRETSADLSVKALGKSKKLKAGKRAKLIRSASSDGQITKVKTSCHSAGQRLKGKALRSACKVKVKNATTNPKVLLTPRCTQSLTAKVKIKAQAGEQTAVWQRTWRVKPKPQIPCG